MERNLVVASDESQSDGFDEHPASERVLRCKLTMRGCGRLA